MDNTPAAAPIPEAVPTPPALKRPHEEEEAAAAAERPAKRAKLAPVDLWGLRALPDGEAAAPRDTLGELPAARPSRLVVYTLPLTPAACHALEAKRLLRPKHAGPCGGHSDGDASSVGISLDSDMEVEEDEEEEDEEAGEEDYNPAADGDAADMSSSSGSDGKSVDVSDDDEEEGEASEEDEEEEVHVRKRAKAAPKGKGKGGRLQRRSPPRDDKEALLSDDAEISGAVVDDEAEESDGGDSYDDDEEGTEAAMSPVDALLVIQLQLPRDSPHADVVNAAVLRALSWHVSHGSADLIVLTAIFLAGADDADPALRASLDDALLAVPLGERGRVAVERLDSGAHWCTFDGARQHYAFHALMPRAGAV